jgi:hypothetical protein
MGAIRRASRAAAHPREVTMEGSDKRERRRSVDGAVPFGVALIALGVVLALDAADVVDAGELLAGWWPVAIVGAGLWWAVTGAAVVGLLVVLVGALLLTTTQEVVEAPVGALVLPAVLVLIGGAMLQAAARLRTARTEIPAHASGSRGTTPGQAATAVFGDARLTLAAARPEQDRLLVAATSIFGDVRIEVPTGWRVEDRMTRLLGDVKLPTSPAADPATPVVELHGLALFGDVDVRYLREGRR